MPLFWQVDQEALLILWRTFYFKPRHIQLTYLRMLPQRNCALLTSGIDIDGSFCTCHGRHTRLLITTKLWEFVRIQNTSCRRTLCRTCTEQRKSRYFYVVWINVSFATAHAPPLTKFFTWLLNEILDEKQVTLPFRVVWDKFSLSHLSKSVFLLSHQSITFSDCVERRRIITMKSSNQ